MDNLAESDLLADNPEGSSDKVNTIITGNEIRIDSNSTIANHILK